MLHIWEGEIPSLFLLMQKLFDLVDRVSKLDIEKATKMAFTVPGLQKYIIGLNQFQLSYGRGNKGQQLRTYMSMRGNVYADSTIEKKKKKHQVWRRMILHDKGKYYKTWWVTPFNHHARIMGKDKKEDGYISDNVDMSEVYGIDPKNMGIMAKAVTKELIPEVRRALL